MEQIAALARVFGQLSLVAIGGVMPILPEMQRQVVDVHHWMGAREFTALFALAQAAPGPNMLISTLVGWRVAGLAGAVVATLGMVGPPAVLAYATTRVWQRFREAGWRRQVQAGLTPVTVGLVTAAAALFCATTSTGIATALLTAAATGMLLTTRLNPLWILAAGALLGVVGLV
jgi:chromate transporter